MTRRLTIVLALVSTLMLAACDPVNYLAIRNETDTTWIVGLVDGSDIDQQLRRAVIVEPRQEGTIDEGIGYHATNVVLILMTIDCRLADAQTVSGDRVWLRIWSSSLGTSLDEIDVPAQARLPNLLLDDGRCVDPSALPG